MLLRRMEQCCSTALAILLELRLDAAKWLCCRVGRNAEFGDSRQYFPPMTERNIDVLEVLIGQIREYRNIDFAIGKAFHVLGHTEVLEPVLNVLHRAPGSYLQPATARSLPVLAEIEETRPSRRRTHRTHRIVASSVPSYRPFWVRFNSPPMSALRCAEQTIPRACTVKPSHICALTTKAFL